MACQQCRPSRRPRVLVADVFWFEADTPGVARAEALRWADTLSAAVGHPVSAIVEDGTGRVLGTALGSGHWAPLAVAAE